VESDLVTVLSELIQTVGMWAVFAVLFLQERKAHNDTRQLWNDDLREIAGLNHPLMKIPPTLPVAE